MHTFIALTLVALAPLQDKPAAAGPKKSAFTAVNEIVLTPPKDAQTLKAWIALPQEDALSELRDLEITAPVPHKITQDSEGNRVLYIEASAPFPAEFKVKTSFGITRSEQRMSTDPKATRPHTEAELKELAHDLLPNANIVITDEVRELARKIVGDEKNPVIVAKKLYDWTLVNVDYWVKDPAHKKASPVGSSEYCLSTRTGNCTDFHSLYAALARAAQLPTRILYGSFFKAELDGKDTDQSYHCWLEFHAPQIGWIPIDVAIADIFVGDFKLDKDNETLVKRTTAAGYEKADPKMVEYYFGNIDERRVLWSRGRDLVLDPATAAGNVNALPKAHVEIDGAVAAEKTGWTRKLTYHQKR
ncbi:MAG: transglutaminase domain-containing protein [Planctomycetes bacterium]|nr:transglutaminase domain-containing protein [Planctomycetota bacterium]